MRTLFFRVRNTVVSLNLLSRPLMVALAAFVMMSGSAGRMAFAQESADDNSLPVSNNVEDMRVPYNSMLPSTQAPSLTAPAKPPHWLVYYFESWTEKDGVSNVKETNLAKISPNVNMLDLAFISPGAVYKGDGDLSQTGFDYDEDLLPKVMTYLRARHPGMKIMLSIGGWGANWSVLNAVDIARVVKDFGFDGVDIDYEPALPLCGSFLGLTPRKCQSDKTFEYIISKIREALPRPALVSIAAWSTGAYGWGPYRHSPPESIYAGELLRPLKTVGSKLDMINIMGYNSGTEFNPLDSLKAYKALFNGDVNLGLQTPPEDTGGHALTPEELHRLTKGVRDLGGAGMMLWTNQEDAGTQSASFPERQIINEISTDLGYTPNSN